MSAADRLRQAVEALPEHLRCQWEYHATSVYMDGRTYGSIKARTGGPSPVAGVSGERGEYIALMNPTVGVALADLLDALHTALRNGWDGARLDYLAEWRILEAAINGSDTPFAAALGERGVPGGS